MKKLSKEFNQFFMLVMLLIVSVLLIYFVPASLNRVVFLFLLVPIWFSKSDYFWYAYVLLVLEQPGGLFSGGIVDDPYRLPIYNLYSGVSFSFIELYIFLIILKPIIKGKLNVYNIFIFKKEFQVLGGLLVLLLVITFVQGVSYSNLERTYKTLISLSLYFSAIFVFRKEADIISFFKAIFPFVFIALFLQLYGITQNQQIVALFKPGVTLTQGVLSGELKRPVEIAVILLLSFFGSLLFIGTRKRHFSKIYLVLINTVSFVSIIMTATRSWFLGFVAVYLFYFILNLRFLKSSFLYASIGIAFIVFLIMFMPSLGSQIQQASGRLETIEELAKGDITAGGTLNRLTERGPRVMEGYKKSTILFGAGFSNVYYEYGDGHVGYQNILLHSGILGFIVLFGFLINIYLKPYGLSLKIRNPDQKYILRNLTLVIPAILIINSGTQFWGYTVNEISRVMFLGFYISIINTFINQAYKNYRMYIL